MGLGINTDYNSYYMQNLNNFGVNSLNTTDKTVVSSSSEAVDTNTEDEYFKKLCNKYPDININISDSYMTKGNKVTFNISPDFIKKAASDSTAAKTLNGILDKASTVTQYVNDNKYSLGEKEVEDLSFKVDKDGNVSCKLNFEEGDSKNVTDVTIKDEDANINLDTAGRFPKDSKIAVEVSVAALAKAVYDSSLAKKLNNLLASLDKQMSSMSDYIDGLSDVFTGKDASSTKFVIDENGECSCNINFQQDDEVAENETNSYAKSVENQVDARNRKLEVLKEVQEGDKDETTKKKLSYYYSVD